MTIKWNLKKFIEKKHSMPKSFILFCLNFDLIKFFPSFFNPFILVNITKMIKRDSYNEFRIRGAWMIIIEGKNLIYNFLRRAFKSKNYAYKKRRAPSAYDLSA